MTHPTPIPEAIEWRKITCLERNAVYSLALVPGATRTDLEGRFGVPTIFTEWLDPASLHPVLRDWRWPNPDGTRPDLRACEHYIPDPPRRPA